MTQKNVSLESYQWGHFGAIMFDVIISLIIAILAYRSRNMILNSGRTAIKKNILKLNLTIIFWLSVVVSIITLLGLIVIFNGDDKIIIN